jgi:hypothetical protein
LSTTNLYWDWKAKGCSCSMAKFKISPYSR